MIKILFILAILPLIILPVYSQETFLSVQTHGRLYTTGDIIIISGGTSLTLDGSPVTMQIFHNDNLIHIAQPSMAQDKTYSHTIIAEEPLLTYEGWYTVRVSYQDQTTETEFHYDGAAPPQFPLILNSIHNNTLSQQVIKWNDQLNQTTHSITQNMIEYDTAISNNSTVQIDRYTRIIGDLLAMQNIYNTLIDELSQMFNSYS